jgi:aminopeptidase-like protein
MQNDIGQLIYSLIVELFPICRSITGNGFRESLKIINKHIPIKVTEVPTGTKVFDWVVPKEWNIRDAYVKDGSGAKIIDFQNSNLQVVNYSVPIHKKVVLPELLEHLYSIPEHADWIPYKTSYYEEKWGFCLPHQTLQYLTEGEYEVLIDSSLESGSLSYGEVYLKGESTDEVLISCHSCHPSLCNDNLSGMGLTTYLAKELLTRPALRYSYRFLFIPGTIGSITWLSINKDRVDHIKHGLVVACVGDPGRLTYKKSRRGDTEIDQAVMHVLKHSNQESEILDFSPYGYDERQYCSPGFNLPVGSLTRTPHGHYPQYHTSADNLDFVQPVFLADSFQTYMAVFNILEHNHKYMNLNPCCEPQLGKRGLYSSIGGRKETNLNELALLWVLNYSDGSHSLLDIAEKSDLRFDLILSVTDLLVRQNLLKRLP